QRQLGPEFELPVLRRLTELPRRRCRIREHLDHGLIATRNGIACGFPCILDTLWQTVHQALGKLVHESADKRVYEILRHEPPDRNRRREEVRRPRHRLEEEDERLRDGGTQSASELLERLFHRFKHRVGNLDASSSHIGAALECGYDLIPDLGYEATEALKIHARDEAERECHARERQLPSSRNREQRDCSHTERNGDIALNRLSDCLAKALLASPHLAGELTNVEHYLPARTALEALRHAVNPRINACRDWRCLQRGNLLTDTLPLGLERLRVDGRPLHRRQSDRRQRLNGGFGLVPGLRHAGG